MNISTTNQMWSGIRSVHSVSLHSMAVVVEVEVVEVWGGEGVAARVGAVGVGVAVAAVKGMQDTLPLAHTLAELTLSPSSPMHPPYTGGTNALRAAVSNSPFRSSSSGVWCARRACERCAGCACSLCGCMWSSSPSSSSSSSSAVVDGDQEVVRTLARGCSCR
jgi:hypothetical protein